MAVDPADFGARVAPYRPGVRRMLRGLLPSPEDAEDLWQEALLHAFVALPGLRRPELFGAWLRTVAYNRAMEWRRRRRVDAAMTARLRVVPPPPPADRVATAAERLDVAAALGLLRPEDRRLVVLRYGQSFSAAEIAWREGLPAATVRSRLHRARRLLRREMDRE